MTERKHDVDGWPLCLTCGKGRAQQIDWDECYDCALAREGIRKPKHPKAKLPWPYDSSGR